jgi:hypothetical protein
MDTALQPRSPATTRAAREHDKIAQPAIHRFLGLNPGLAPPQLAQLLQA